MMQCPYCNQSADRSHTCWAKYCIETLKRNCAKCTNRCKYGKDRDIPDSEEPRHKKGQPKIEIVEI